MSSANPVREAHVRWWPLVRYFLGVALGVVVLVVLFAQRGDLRSALHELDFVEPWWVVGAVGAESGSLLMFALAQRWVLRAGGATIALPSLFAISLANNAIANTVPGEPAVSSAFRYREYRRRGATGASSGWAILTVIVAQAIGMSCVLLVGVIITIATSTDASVTGAALVGVAVIIAAGVVLVRRDVLIGFMGHVVRGFQRVTGHPRGDLAARVAAALERMRAIRLTPLAMFGLVALATMVWLLDLACLLCAFASVHASIPWHGVVLAYGVAQIVAVLPLVPGGLGLVEGGLTVVLVAYGSTRVHALSTVLIYRAVSFWLAVVVGWASFGLLAVVARRTRRTNALRSSDGFDHG
ncbi:MAG: YbhN family protein [Acidimicrobiales bacterium]